MSKILNNNNLKINEDSQAHIINNFKKIYQEKINSGFKRLTIKKSWIYSFTLLIILAIILFICSFFNNDKKIGSFLFYIAIIIIVISSINLSFPLFFLKQAIEKEITNDLIFEYYFSVWKNNIEKLNITNITNNFSLFPQNFVPRETYNSTIYCEKVIIGNYLNQEFNVGTILEKIKEEEKLEDDTDLTEYNRYLFFTINISKYDFTTTIKPESFFNKIAERNKIKLESREFEKIFALDYSDPIKLRKLFEPKVMMEMVDYSKTNSIPYIYLNQTQVTVMYPYYNVENSKTGSLINFKISIDFNKTAKSFIKGIENDLRVFLLFINWIKILNLI